MNLTTVIGIIASVLTGTSLIPQLIKVVREKKADGISWGMLGVLFAGLGFWIWYGILKKDLIIIIANGFSMMINIIICILSVLYKRR